MPRIRLFHWKAEEAASLTKALRAMRQSPPDVIVIDLSRLPSHGREVATYLRGQKPTRHIPIVFVDGEPDKVEAIRKLLPDAVYASSAKMRSAVREALANRPANPVVPPQMMERYASRTAAQKLGIREGATVAVIDPPRNYSAMIGELPAGAVFEESPEGACGITLWCVHDAAASREALPEMRRLAARTKLWILWRKGSSVTQPLLRESAAAVGLVDYKICSVGGAWSGMLFARRKSV